MKSCADKPPLKPKKIAFTAVRNIKSLGTKHPVAVGQLPLATEQNFFSGFEIYFQGFKIYFQASEIYFQSLEIVLFLEGKEK